MKLIQKENSFQNLHNILYHQKRQLSGEMESEIPDVYNNVRDQCVVGSEKRKTDFRSTKNYFRKSLVGVKLPVYSSCELK